MGITIYCDIIYDVIIHTHTFHLQKTQALTGAIRGGELDIVKGFIEEGLSISVSK